jgi:hypothetical protein
LYFVLKSSITGRPDGEPPATSSAFEILAIPLMSLSSFLEAIVASTSSRPPRPTEGLRNPLAARLSALTVTFPSSGVSDASSWFIGPTVPANMK